MVPWSSIVVACCFAVGQGVARDVDSVVLGTCENGTNSNELGYHWYWYSDQKYNFDTKSKLLNPKAVYDSITNSFSDFIPAKGEGNSNGTPGYGARIDYVLGMFVGVGIELCDPGKSVDLTGLEKVSFWAKSSTPTVVEGMLLTQPVKDYAYHRRIFNVDTEWKKYEIDLQQTTVPSEWYLQQASWGGLVTFDITKMQRISFHVSESNNANGQNETLWIDDIVAYGKIASLTTAVKPVASINPNRVRVRQSKHDLIFTAPAACAPGTVSLIDFRGRVLVNRSYRAAAGAGERRINLSGIPGGCYFFKVKEAGFQFVQPVTIYK